MMGDKGQAIFDLSTGFEGERMRIPISLAKEPATMHLDKANDMLSKYEHTLNPVVTGGTVIGIRCKDGTLIAADTMASYGSYQKFTDVQRIHKVGFICPSFAPYMYWTKVGFICPSFASYMYEDPKP